MGEQESSAFALVYEGPRDEDPATLSRIKGVFIADLELSIPEVQQILQALPAIIKQSDDEESLEPFRRVLARAGAKVMIVQQRATAVPEHLSADAATDDSAVFELSLEDLGLSGTVRSPHRESAPVYELPETDIAGSLEEVLKEADQSTQQEMILDDHSNATAAAEQTASDSALDVESDAAIPIVTVIPEAAGQEHGAITVANPPEAELSMHIDAESQPSTADAPAPEPAPTPPADNPPLLQFSTGDETAEEREDEAPPAETKPVAMVSGLEFEDMAASLAAPLPEEPPPSVPTADEIKSDGLDLFGALEELKRTESEPPSPLDADEAAFREQDQALQMESSASAQPIIPPPSAEQEIQPLLTRPLNNQLKEGTEPATPVAALASAQAAAAQPPKEAIAAPEQPQRKRQPMLPKTRRTLPLDVIVTVLVAGVLLGIANWYYFGAAIQPLAPQVELATPEELEELYVPPVALRNGPSVAPLEFQGESKIGALTTKATFFGNTGVIYTGAIQLSSDAPPELTPEQIVRNEQRPPWASRVQLYDLSFARDESGSFVANGPAKVTIEYKGQKIRAVGAGFVRISFPVSPNMAKAYVEVSDAKLLTALTSTVEGAAQVTATSDNTFSFHFMSSVEAALKSPPTSAEPDQKPKK